MQRYTLICRCTWGFQLWLHICFSMVQPLENVHEGSALKGESGNVDGQARPLAKQLLNLAPGGHDICITTTASKSFFFSSFFMKPMVCGLMSQMIYFQCSPPISFLIFFVHILWIKKCSLAAFAILRE